MATYNALQISLKELYLDRHTDYSMYGYVVGLAQRNIDGPGQLYVTQGSFKIRRDGRAATKTDRVYRWDGDGELIFSTKTEGLERVGLDLYFVRDRRRMRDFGNVLREAFEQDAIGSEVAKSVVRAIAKTNPSSSAIVALGPKVARFIGSLLAKKRDGVKVRAEGSLKLESIVADDEEAGDDDVSERLWGRSRADKGYFVTEWDLVTMEDPERHVVPAKLPDDLVKRLG